MLEAYINNTKEYMPTHERYGHMLREHVIPNNEVLKNKLLDGRHPKNKQEVVLATRFYSEKQAIRIVTIALKAKMTKIDEWLKKDISDRYSLLVKFSSPTGEGINFNGDWNQCLPVHGLRVVLDRGRKYEPFYIRTAYPEAVAEDMEQIMDEAEKFQSKKLARRQNAA